MDNVSEVQFKKRIKFFADFMVKTYCYSMFASDTENTFGVSFVIGPFVPETVLRKLSRLCSVSFLIDVHDGLPCITLYSVKS